MANPALVQSTSNSNGISGTSVSVTLNGQVAGNFNFVGVTLCNDSVCSTQYTGSVSVSDGVNTYQQVTDSTSASTHGDVTCFYAENIASGNRTIAVTTSLTSFYLTAIASEWSGVATSSSYDVSGHASGNSANPSVSTSSATTAANDLVLGVVADDNVPTAASPYTTITTVGGANVEYQVGASATTYSATWTASSGKWDAVIAAFKAAVAGGFTAKFRKTLSPMGTKVGSRQLHDYSH